MKKFVSENWYKMMIGSSLLMASFGFMIHSVSPAMADSNNQKLNVNSNYKLVPTNVDGSINVKLSDEQVSKMSTPTGLQRVVVCGANETPVPQGSYGGLQVYTKN